MQFIPAIRLTNGNESALSTSSIPSPRKRFNDDSGLPANDAFIGSPGFNRFKPGGADVHKCEKHAEAFLRHRVASLESEIERLKRQIKAVHKLPALNMADGIAPKRGII